MAKNATMISNPIWGPQNVFQWFYLDNVPGYHPMQFTGKLINQTCKHDKKANFGPDLGLFSLNVGSQFFCVSFSFN